VQRKGSFGVRRGGYHKVGEESRNDREQNEDEHVGTKGACTMSSKPVQKQRMGL